MTNWKRLYTDVAKMLDDYQDKFVPQLKEQIAELKADNERLRNMWAEAVSKLSKAQSNRVESVRCKDCDNTCPGNSGLVCTMWGAGTDPDGWCYKGERRTDGNL